MHNIIEIDIIELSPEEVHQDQVINLSAKIISLLSAEVKRHNKSLPASKVSLSQLKSVFKNGAASGEAHSGKYTKIQAGIARVNSFLEMVAGKPIDLIYKRKNKEIINNLFDYFENVNFSDAEIIFASEQALAFDIALDEDFGAIENLYLDLEGEKQFWFEI